MAGLLDFLSSPDAQFGLGLLGAAAPRAGGVNFGQGLQEALGYVDKQRQMKAAELAQAQEIEYKKAVMAEHQQKQAMQAAAMAQAERKQQAMPQIFRPASQGAPAMNMDSMLPAELQTGLPSIGAVSARPASIDVQKGLEVGMTADELMKMDGLRNIGMNEVARTVKGMQGGREVEQQFDKFGRPVGQGMEQFRAPIEMGLGDKKQLLDPFSLQPKASFAIGQSPDSKASNAVAWANNSATLRGQDMTDARSRDLNEIKRDEKKKVEDLTKGGQIASFDTMLGTLDRLGQHPGLSRSVGLMGALPTMPGSESANFKAELETFQSQAFIPMVSQLKGMGALSDAEGKKLTAAVGALNPNMGEKAFRESVGRITEEMSAARERVSGAPKPKANQLESLPIANASNKGKKIRDTTTGQVLVSNGMSWVKE